MKNKLRKRASLVLAFIIFISALPIGSLAAVEPPNWDKPSDQLSGKLNYWPLDKGQSLNTVSGANSSIPLLEMNYLGKTGDYAHFTTRLSGERSDAWGYDLMLRADDRLEKRVDMTKSYFERDGQKYNLSQEKVDSKLIARAKLTSIFQKNYDKNKPPVADFYLYVGPEELAGDYIVQGRFYYGNVGSEKILNYTALTSLHPALQDKDPYKFYTNTYSMSNTLDEKDMNFGVPKKNIPWTNGNDQVFGISSFFQLDNEKNKLRVFYVWRGWQQADNNDFSKTKMIDGKYYNIGFRIAFPNEFYDVLRPTDGVALTNYNPKDERNINYIGRYTQIGQAGHTFVDTSYAGNASNQDDDEKAMRGIVGLKGESDFTGGSNNNSSNAYPEGAFNQRVLTTNNIKRGNHGDFTSIDIVGKGFNESATSNAFKANRDGRHISIVSRAPAPVANVFEFNIDPKKFREKFYDKDGNYNNKLVFRNSFVFNEKGTNDLIELDKSSSYAAGTGEATQHLPMVEEIFTDSIDDFKGYTLYSDSRAHYFISNKDKEISGFVNTAKYSSLVNFKGEEYNAYKFSVSRKDDIDVIKDMPIEFMAEEKGKIPSKSVVEQVQTKVKFNLNGQGSMTGGSDYIEKILPLNKEYSITLDEKENPNYKPSGFAKIEHDSNTDEDKIVGGGNLKIDQENPIVNVEQKLPKGNVAKRKVINYLDHNNENYDINSDDEITQIKEVNALIKRQFPIPEEVNLPNFTRLLGWTTVKLEDKKDSDGKVTKTAQEQFYELKNKKDSDGKPTSYIRKIQDWKKVDDSQENMIFDEYSPVDKERTVYAVYGSPLVVLHSGIKDKNGKEIIVNIPIKQGDVDTTANKMIGLDQSEIDERIKSEIIKEIPKAPYSKDDKSGADDRLLDFVKDGQTFIGWTVKEKPEGFIAGNNNQRISELNKGKDSAGNNLIKSTGWYSYIRDNPKKAYLPNGFNLGISAKAYDKNGNLSTDANPGGETLSTVEELLEKGKDDIHLYANYRPYFNIKVKPQYNLFKEPTQEDPNHEWGSLVEGVEEEKQRPLQIGLMERTAVTGYGEPTVDAAANYFPIGGVDKLQKWDPKNNSEYLEWTEPGFDILGRRKSFVALVVSPDKEQTYVDFAKPFSGQSWSQMGTSIFIKKGGTSLDPNAPKNLYYDDYPERDPYGKPLAKLQNFKLETTDPNSNEEEIDSYTSATSRAPIKNKNAGKNEDLDPEDIVGYDIVMTNLLQQLPAPVFERVKYDDTKVLLDWDKTVNYDDIDKIEIYSYVYDKTTNSVSKDPKTFTLTEREDGKFTYSKNGVNIIGEPVKYTNNEGYEYYRLEITGLDLNKLGGKDIGAKYFNTVNEQESSIGNTRIIGPKISAEVSKIIQGVKKDSTENVKIKFTVPEKALDKVGPNTKYIAEKWDGETSTWIKVGERVLSDDDLINNKFEGNEYDIQLYENEDSIPQDSDFAIVKDGDIVRIISIEANRDEDKLDEDGNVEQLGYSKPAYSAGRDLIIEKDESGKEIITGYEEEDRYIDESEKEKVDYLKLDLSAPEGEIIGEDEKFRRFVNISGELDEIPENQKVILEINTSGSGQGDENNDAYEFETKNEAIEYINQLLRYEEMPDMWIIAKDYVGNTNIIKIKYEKTYVCTVMIRDFRSGMKKIGVTSDKAGTVVTVDVYSGKNKLASGESTVTEADKFVDLNFMTSDGKNYRIRKGNRLHVTAEAPGDEASNGVIYTANPFDKFIR